MAKHLNLNAAKESTRRALRTVLQGLYAAGAGAVAVAIPPVADAVNAVLHQVNPAVTVTPGLVAAIGATGAALVGVVSKLQNLLEGRDKVTSPTEAAAQIQELTALVAELRASGATVVREGEKSFD